MHHVSGGVSGTWANRGAMTDRVDSRVFLQGEERPFGKRQHVFSFLSLFLGVRTLFLGGIREEHPQRDMGERGVSFDSQRHPHPGLRLRPFPRLWSSPLPSPQRGGPAASDSGMAGCRLELPTEVPTGAGPLWSSCLSSQDLPAQASSVLAGPTLLSRVFVSLY